MSLLEMPHVGEGDDGGDASLERPPITQQRKSRACSVLKQLERLEETKIEMRSIPSGSFVAPMEEESDDDNDFQLSSVQISQLKELFGLIDNDNSRTVDIKDMIDFVVSHNLCTRGDALGLEAYVEDEKSDIDDPNKITFPQFSSIAIAFDLLHMEGNDQQRVMNLKERSSADAPPGLVTREVASPKRKSFVNRLFNAVTFKKTKVVRMESVLDTFNSNLMASQNQNGLSKIEKPFYIFDPHDQKRLGWDFMILVLLVYTAMWVPIRVGFDYSPGGLPRILEVTVDLLFLTDVVVNFLTAYEGENGHLSLSLSDIAKRYVKQWFLIDVVSSIPLDLFVSNEDEGISNITSIFKLLKILRVFRALRVFARLEEELNLQGRRPMKMIKISIGVVFIMHLFACGWAFMARQGTDYHVDSWVAQAGLINRELVDEYFFSLYWAVTTLTTVGYGDISPVNNSEVVFATFAMMIGGALYGYVVALFATLMQGLDPNERMYHERMESIMCYMRHRNFPQKLFKQVTNYYTHFFKYKTALDETSILDDLSYNLQQEVGEFLVRTRDSSAPRLRRRHLTHALRPFLRSGSKVLRQDLSVLQVSVSTSYSAAR